VVGTSYPATLAGYADHSAGRSDQGKHARESVPLGNVETVEVEGRARMALARLRSGGHLTDGDRAALDACPEPGSVFTPGAPFPPAAAGSSNLPTTPDGLASVRQRRRIRARRRAWVDTSSGAGITDDGRRFVVQVLDVGGLLAGLPDDVRAVQLVGARPGGDADGFARWRESCAGWVEGEHYVESLMFPVLRYEREGRRVDVSRAASWFGEGAYTVEQARDAMAATARIVGELFAGAELWATPATTGRELWRASIPAGRSWPVLDDETQQLIRSTSGQGRVELRDVGDELPGLAELDGRFMYGALCWGLPTGRPTRGRGEAPGWRPQTRGRFHCRWTVPAGWDHVGLLPAKDDAGGWRYPAAPGEVAEGWVDGAELALARAQGWPVDVLEHLVFVGEDGGDPMRAWADKLVTAWGRAGELRGVADEPAVDYVPLVQAAIRSILLHGIGAFAGRPHMVTRSADDAAAIPRGAVMPRWEGERWVWGERAASAMPELSHPEWATAVWARCRVRLLDGPTGSRSVRSGALHVPASSVVAMRTDALYLTERPAWPDDGKVGRLRVKAWQEGPLRAPRTVTELLRLREHGRGI
jgi:hypothetical protein